jgi:hypothetical protein
MNKKRWSDYGKYIVLADEAGIYLLGNYTTFQNFKRVKLVVEKIATTEKAAYLFEDKFHKTKITASDAQSILENINKCNWNLATKKILKVANQLNLRI